MLSFFSYTGTLGSLLSVALYSHTRVDGRLQALTALRDTAEALQSTATQQQVVADELRLDASIERKQASALEANADALFAQSKAQIVEAQADEASAAALDTQVVSVENQANQAWDQAVLEQVAARSQLAEATSWAETAAETSLRAHAEETGLALCQWIPGVDVICDTIGTWTAASLELTSAAETADAGVDLAAAAEAQEQADAEDAMAVALDAQAAKDETQAQTLHETATELTEQGAAERAEAEADQERAEQEVAEAEAQDEVAAKDDAQAAEELTQGGQVLQESIRQGIKAVWYALVEVGAALGATLLVAARFLLRWWSSSQCCASRSDSPSLNNKEPIWIAISYWYHTVVISIILVAFTGARFLANVPNHNTILLGEQLLQLALVTLGVQMLLLHGPLVWTVASKSAWWVSVIRVSTDATLLLGWNVFIQVVLWAVIPRAYFDALVSFEYCLLILTAGTLLLHHHWSQFSCVDEISSNYVDEEECVCTKATLEGVTPTETTALLSRSQVGNDTQESIETTAVFKPHHSLLWESLVASVALTLLWSCVVLRTPILRPFWPMVRHILSVFVQQYRWYFAVVVALMVGASILWRGVVRIRMKV